MNRAAEQSNVSPSSEAPRTWLSAPGHAVQISVAWISRPCAGETTNGDAVVVRDFGGGALVALIDGLGHGPKAAHVACLSSAWLEAAPDVEGAAAIVHGLHAALRGSRGAAALILVLSVHGVEACSVGNVDLRSATGKLPFVLTPGVLGVRLRQPRICCAPPPTNERFFLFSDGISGRFDYQALRSLSPLESASQIFASHRHKHDDATVVVIDVTSCADLA